MNWGEVVGYDGFQVGLENRFGVKFTFQLLRFVLVSMHLGLVVKDRLKKFATYLNFFDTLATFYNIDPAPYRL